jgi:hypothetical protein
MNETGRNHQRLFKTRENQEGYKSKSLSTGKWMELENIILSKVSQTQKAKNLMFSLICKL